MFLAPDTCELLIDAARFNVLRTKPADPNGTARRVRGNDKLRSKVPVDICYDRILIPGARGRELREQDPAISP
jgi:hypothetical protein